MAHLGGRHTRRNATDIHDPTLLLLFVKLLQRLGREFREKVVLWLFFLQLYILFGRVLLLMWAFHSLAPLRVAYDHGRWRRVEST